MSVNRRWIVINSISIVLHLCHSVYGAIKGPSQIEGVVGDNARFKWNTTDSEKILSAAWGLRNGEMADPQFINVNALNNYQPSLNLNMGEQYVGRVQFIGDLQAGHAWFMIKNLPIQDSNEYTARISDDNVEGLASYHVQLVVKNSTEDSTPTPIPPSSVTPSSKTNTTSNVTKDSTPTPTQPSSVTPSSKTNTTSNVTTPSVQSTPTSSKTSTSFCTLGIIFIITTTYAGL